MTVLVLPSNRPAARFYRGGRRITDFRGEPPAAEYEPEDWVGSVTPVNGEAPAGQTTLPDGTLLADAIAAEPRWWLGPAHVASFGADPMLLVKLLDAGQRLPVHAHPDGAWAAAHLGTAHGKTEAWYVLTPGEVHLGLARDLERAELDDIVARQDVASLLGAMHRLEVGPGDVVYVPAGVLHAIGEGILLVELQEPEDLSILAEWHGFAIDGPAKGHLGVGFDTALGAVEHRARSAAEIAGLVHRAGGDGPLLPSAAEAFFRLEHVRVDGSAELDPGFAIGVVLDGEVDAAAHGNSVPDAGGGVGVSRLVRGSTVVLPHAAGVVRVTGAGELLVCRPPLPR
ncbi:class I mannose-6-phosphate isomerase [Microbacterium timonense]|uniref:class I mannose-6-phosphate isomerase n=1 Tax=Microbacterium timonense TaxID=2086576 RepID=UPI000D0E9999|nr:class I mannose-6-phosphate isomerase [Microbacterium timonense]